MWFNFGNLLYHKILYTYIYIYCNIAKAWVHPGSPVDVSVPNQGIYMTSGRKVGAITMEGESYQLISGPPWIHTDHYLK